MENKVLRLIRLKMLQLFYKFGFVYRCFLLPCHHKRSLFAYVLSSVDVRHKHFCLAWNIIYIIFKIV